MSTAYRPIPSVTTYTPGTHLFTIPKGTRYIRIVGTGGGGGGGSGRVHDPGIARFGGGGGGGAGFSKILWGAQELGGDGAQLSVVVGAGGAGGLAVGPAATDGNPGNAGGHTSITIVASSHQIFGARGGTAGGAGLVGSGAAGVGDAGTLTGGNGGASSISAAGAQALNPTGARDGCAGGGGGGGINTSNVIRDGGPSNQGGFAWTNDGDSTPGGIGAGVPGSDASSEADYLTFLVPTPGKGGGGGAANLGADAGRGGDGIYGGGGGGGGAAETGFSSGRGGNGGDGYVRIFTW